MPRKRKTQAENSSNKKLATEEDPSDGESNQVEGTSATTIETLNNDASKMKLLCWNVAGIRAAFKKGLQEFVNKQNADIICFTEVKATRQENPLKPEGYHTYWNASHVKKGYSGVAVFTKPKPLKVDYGIGSCDDEGRTIIAEYEKFILLHAYVPNAGMKLEKLPKRMKWDEKFFQFFKNLKSRGKPILWTGDMNVAHLDFDVYDGETNKNRSKSACFTPEERGNFRKLLEEFELVDLYRKFHPTEREKHYTYFSFRSGAKAKNNGWRLDYYMATKDMAKHAISCSVHREENASDHLPLVLDINF